MYNQITLIGNIGSEPLVTNFENGSKVARFSLATDAEVKGQKQTEWHKVFAWGNLAQFIENYAQKGKQIALSGKMVRRSYLTKSGQKRQFTEIEIQHVIGL